MATKFKQYFDEMLAVNREQFIMFKILHDQYAANSRDKNLKRQFNEEGAKVLEIIRETESRLCNLSERGKFGKYSSNLSDKFWEEVRRNYPRIDDVGVL